MSKQHRAWLFGLGMVASIAISQAQDTQAINQFFEPVWSTKIGKTSFKTNILFYRGKLIVGSNGQRFRDWNLDEGFGLYIIDPSHGKIQHQLEGEAIGDMDVNGVIARDNRIYFGNDNDELFCYTLDGKQLWSRPISGDLESKPILVNINADPGPELIYTTETGEVAAADPTDGKKLWSFKTSTFSGWEQTQNRFLFKVSSYARYGNGFYREPAVADLNQDGTPDFLVNGQDERTYAINGTDGTLLWSFETNWYRINNRPVLLGTGKNLEIIVPHDTEKEKGFVVLNTQGKVKRFISFGESYIGANNNPMVIDDQLLMAGRGELISYNTKTWHRKTSKLPQGSFVFGTRGGYLGTIDADMQLADLLGTGKPQLIVMDNEGLLMIIDPKSKKILRKLVMPSYSETTPLIADLNGNGRNELIVSCMDGKLYCYETHGRIAEAAQNPVAPPIAYTCRMY